MVYSASRTLASSGSLQVPSPIALPRAVEELLRFSPRPEALTPVELPVFSPFGDLSNAFLPMVNRQQALSYLSCLLERNHSEECASLRTDRHRTPGGWDTSAPWRQGLHGGEPSRIRQSLRRETTMSNAC